MVAVAICPYVVQVPVAQEKDLPRALPDSDWSAPWPIFWVAAALAERLVALPPHARDGLWIEPLFTSGL